MPPRVASRRHLRTWARRCVAPVAIAAPIATAATLSCTRHVDDANSNAAALELHSQRAALELPKVEDAPAAVTDASPGACATGMAEIAGEMKLDGAEPVEMMQAAVCLRWMPSQYADRCARFDRDRWLAASAPLKTRAMHFCMDRFEFPNRRGANPDVGMSSRAAQRSCAQESKRLCTEDEWTFACEGEEALPYPTGYVRDAEACVIDRALRPVNEFLLVNRHSEITQREYLRLWQGAPSGEHPHCASVFGVEDMIGNVDEWTAATRPGFAAVLKGGYWGPIRARCRPSTRYHGEGFFYYQQGFRCCSDAR